MGCNARKPDFVACKKHRHSPACTSTQSDQRLYVRFLESVVYKLATCKVSIFYLDSVAEQTGFNLSLLETQKRQVFLCPSGSQIRVRNLNLFFLFLNQNICCGYSKEPSQ